MRNPKGFTLIELMVTVTLVAIMASVIAPFVQLNNQRTRERDLKLSLREIRSGIDAYKQAVDDGRVYRSIDESGYPKHLSDLVDGVVDIKDPKSRKIYFLRRVPRDPMNPDVAVSPEESWGVRAYASDPDNPLRGDDVYDVFSLSQKTGLNGTAYREW